MDVLNSRGLGLLKCFLDFWSDLIGFTLCPISPYYLVDLVPSVIRRMDPVPYPKPVDLPAEQAAS